MSPYDNEHFCLKFQKEGTDTIQMRWSLPTNMDAALKKLQALFNDPEEQAGVSSPKFTFDSALISIISSYSVRNGNTFPPDDAGQHEHGEME